MAEPTTKVSDRTLFDLGFRLGLGATFGAVAAIGILAVAARVLRWLGEVLL